MSDTAIEQEPRFEELPDDELRFLRKQLSMDQAQMEARLKHAAGETRERLVRDMHHGESVYAKVQRAINHRLIGDDNE